MLDELQWPELQKRRQQSKMISNDLELIQSDPQASLTLFYKIHNNLVTIDKKRYLSEAGNRSTRYHPLQYHRPNAYMDGLNFIFS